VIEQAPGTGTKGLVPQDIIQLENKYYVSVNSTYADDRVRVLNHVDTFGIFDRWGDAAQIGEEVQGIYHNGTRHLSGIELRLEGHRPLLLSSAIKEGNEMLSVDLTNPEMAHEGGRIPKSALHIGRSKLVRSGACYEQVVLHNYSHTPYTFSATLSFSADFRDIFEVRGIARKARGTVHPPRADGAKQLTLSYTGLDGVLRSTSIQLSHAPERWDEGCAQFCFHLPAGGSLTLEYAAHFLTGDGHDAPDAPDYAAAKAALEADLAATAAVMATVSTDNEQFNQWISRSQFDLISLLARTEHGLYPYAGVPWYNTAFGRDGLITALQTLWIAPQIGRDVLAFAAAAQATQESAFQDAEPGKIFHEMRGGEMVALEEVPFGKYYGSVDATPLFVILAGQYYRRTADADFIRQLWPQIDAALHWMDQYADNDADGFYDYAHKSVNGLFNQGWKDSHDSVSHADGRLAVPPIALCEVQGYVYAAKRQAVKMAHVLGLHDRAAELRTSAEDLKRRFNEKFWDEDLGTYVLAIDGTGEPCRVRASNAAHCLWSGIADEAKARRVAETLLAPDMFSGWGIRTLSSREARYNPMSYHNGSVWPHDVSLAARGFARYGLGEEVLRVVEGLFDASLFIELQRLPELFCGFERRTGEGPTDYPVACSPQAWSVAAVFYLLEACLHIQIDAEEKRVYFNRPAVPPHIHTISIHHLPLGDGHASLDFQCTHNTVGVRVKNKPEGWQIMVVTE